MKAFTVTAEQLAKCPEHGMDASHFRPDGTCAHFCEYCKEKKVAYPGARFCGAACSQRSEAHQ